MGSFSVSCGMSKLPIVSNEEIVFIPLKQRLDYNGKPNGANTNHIIFGEREYFQPFLLPIIGHYDTYGGIENIVKNENIKIIEEHYKKSIEDIFETISNNRGIFDSYSNVPKIWEIDLFRNNNLNSFEKLGFELVKENIGFNLLKEKKEEFMFNKEYNLKIYSKDKSKFEVSDDYTLKYVLEKESFDFEKGRFFIEQEEFTKKIKIIKEVSDLTLQNQIYNITGIVLGLKNKENMKFLKELSNLSGMFVLKEVYDKMSENLNFDEFEDSKIFDENAAINTQKVKGVHLTKLGFERIDLNNFKLNNIHVNLKDYYPKIKIENKETHSSNIKEFIDFLNIETNSSYDINSIKDIVGSKAIMLDLNEDIIFINNKIKSKDEKMILFDKTLHDADKNLFSYNSMYLNKISILMSNENLNDGFMTNIFNELDKFKTFDLSMFTTNTPYMASYSGPQDGCFEICKHLNKITSSILEDRYKEYEMEI